MKDDPKVHQYYYAYAMVLRDYMKDYEKAQEYYLRDINSGHNELKPTGSYGYLSYLMGNYEEAEKQIDIRLEYEKSCNNPKVWTQFYHGLLNMQLGNDGIANNALMKAVNGVGTKAKYKYVLRELKSKEKSSSNIRYFDKFKQLLQSKFK